jgi:uncharacterized membrane protein
VVPASGDQILKNVRVISDIERRTIHERSRLERITDNISESTGSISFIVIHAMAFAMWIVMNLRTRWVFDAYPFNLLNLAVSLEAIFLTSIVLMTQNRLTRQGDKRAHLDLQVNLLAEQELTAILRMVHALCQHAGMHLSSQDERVTQLLKDIDIEKLAATLDTHLPSGGGSASEPPLIVEEPHD